MTGQQRAAFSSVVLPFIIFTAIWGSTWIVIRDQLGTVPPQWSVTYRFVLATIAMAAIARWKGEGLRLGGGGIAAAAVLGFTQFVVIGGVEPVGGGDGLEHRWVGGGGIVREKSHRGGLPSGSALAWQAKGDIFAGASDGGIG